MSKRQLPRERPWEQDLGKTQILEWDCYEHCCHLQRYRKSSQYRQFEIYHIVASRLVQKDRTRLFHLHAPITTTAPRPRLLVIQSGCTQQVWHSRRAQARGPTGSRLLDRRADRLMFANVWQAPGHQRRTAPPLGVGRNGKCARVHTPPCVARLVPEHANHTQPKCYLLLLTLQVP